jgi:hypothetical protein
MVTDVGFHMVLTKGILNLPIGQQDAINAVPPADDSLLHVSSSVLS